MAFYAGKSATVTVGAAVWKLNEWTLDMECELVDVTNFSSSGARENIAGLIKAKVTGKGPYDAAAMAMTAGTTYSIILLVGASISFTITFRIGTLKITTNVEGAAQVEFTGESTGSFTAAIT